jgi:hypothetical protein
MTKEADEQKALVKWLRARKITHFAPINESLHSGIIRQSVKPSGVASRIIGMIENKLKSMGKRKGVSDLVILLPNAKAIFIELKRKDGGKTSAEQIVWRDEVIALGFPAFICHGFDEAVSVINGFIEQ